MSNASLADPRILPPDEIVLDLIRLFFKHIHPWAPFLSPRPYRATFSPPWNIVVHAIVVVTLRLSTDTRLANTKVLIKKAAKQHVLSNAIESTSISSVQALAILALDLIGSEQGPSSWGVLALLTRSAVHLGLTSEEHTHGPGGGTATGFSTPHHFPSRPPVPSLSRTSIIPPSKDWAEDEERRRLFWLIFSLDRYCCVSTGWDFALPDFEIQRRLPCADDIWAQQVGSDETLVGQVLMEEGMVRSSVILPYPTSAERAYSCRSVDAVSTSISGGSAGPARSSTYSTKPSHRSGR